MKSFQRRDRMKIYRDILLCIRDESKRGRIIPTRIQQKANVPFDRLKSYMSELCEIGLIADEVAYELTEKGREYIAEYEKVLDFMKRMGLAYH